MSRRYRGHRPESFEPIDINELVELRARQRTFHGAYSRSALGSLCYALTILRLFDHRFYKIGLLFAILGGLLFVLAFLRSRHSQHDFADYDDSDVKAPLPNDNSSDKEDDEYNDDNTYVMYRYGKRTYKNVVKTVGQTGKRVFGRPFVSAGWIVVAVSGVVAVVEVGLLVLVLRI